MYKHHEESLQIMVSHYKKRSEVIALIFGGSVAKGQERIDSDLDAMAVVSEECFREMDARNQTTEVVHGMCTYPEGYFDVKFVTKEFLRQAAKKGSEPTRNSFIGSRVLYSGDPEIEGIVAKIPVFQRSEMAEKMLSFYSDFQLNYGYFWKSCQPKGYMRIRTASEIVYAIYRMILQENEVLFPCNRRLEECIAALDHKPEGILELCGQFCDQLDEAVLDEIVKRYHEWTQWNHPTDINIFCSRYQMDFEKWWLYPRPLIAEW